MGHITTIIGSGRILGAIWILLFVLAMGWLLRPVPELPATPGWSNWKQVGAVFSILPYRDGVLAAGANGIWYLDAKSAQRFTPEGPAADVVVHELVLTRDNSLWVGHSRGVSLLSAGIWTHLDSQDGIPEPPIYALALDELGGWIGGEGGLVRFQGSPPWQDSDLTRIAPSAQIPVSRISALMQDRSGGVWVGSNEPPRGGLFRHTPAAVTFWGTDSGLPHPQVTSLLEDNSGRIWAGTGFHNRGGAALFASQGQKWELVATLDADDLAGPKVRSLAQDSSGHYWIGSESSGLAIRNDRSLMRVLNRAAGLPDREVTAIRQTSDGAVWLATLKGVVRIDPRTISDLTAKVGGGSS
jgi:ligand-binding sensor domain-containing protein